MPAWCRVCLACRSVEDSSPPAGPACTDPAHLVHPARLLRCCLPAVPASPRAEAPAVKSGVVLIPTAVSLLQLVTVTQQTPFCVGWSSAARCRTLPSRAVAAVKVWLCFAVSDQAGANGEGPSVVGLLPSLLLHRDSSVCLLSCTKSPGKHEWGGVCARAASAWHLECGMLWPAAGNPAARHEEQPSAVLRLSNHRNKDNIHNWSQADFH